MLLSKHQYRCAFSVIELLVVISVIALLLGILLPALAQVRATGMRVRCVSNLAGVGSAAVLRAQDAEGFIPLAGMVRSRHKTDDTPRGLPGILNDAHKRRYTYRDWHLGGGNLAKIVEPFQLSLLPYLDPSFPGIRELGISLHQHDPLDPLREAFPAFRLFECPDGEDAAGGHSSITVQLDTTQWNSLFLNRWDYAFNEAVVGFDDRPGRIAGRARGLLTRVADPSRTVLTGDARRPTTVFDGGYTLGPTFAWKPTSLPIHDTLTLADIPRRHPHVRGSAGVDDRHRGRTNVLFVDGHVETLRNKPDDLRRGVLRIPGE